MSPVLMTPPLGNPAGTKFTPYGFKSPEALTVDTVFSVGRKGVAALAATTPPQAASTAAATVVLTARAALMVR